MTTRAADLEKSPFPRFKTPAYRYIRATDAIPTIDAVANVADPIVKVKLFNPTGIGTWYIAAYDPETRVAFGAAHLFEYEIGDFSMAELTEIRGLMGLPIERDLHWTPKPLSECGKAHGG